MIYNISIKNDYRKRNEDKRLSDTNDKQKTDGIVAKRNIKDCVFTNMFGDKNELTQTKDNQAAKL